MKKITVPTAFVSLFFLGVLLLLTLDSIGSSTKVLRLLGTSSLAISAVFLFIFGAIRSRMLVRLTPIVAMLVGYAAVIVITLSVILTFWTFHSPLNYVYSLTRLNVVQLLWLGQFLLLVWLINKTNVWWKKNISNVIRLLPFWILAFSYLVSLLPFDVFVGYASEDGLMEVVQVLILFSTVGLSLHEALLLHKNKDIKKAGIFMFIGLATLVFAMEEISWGQRIVGWQTPAALSEINVQNETTLHNIGILNQLQLVAYIAITFFGTLLSGNPITTKKALPWFFWNPPKAAFWLYSIPFVFYTSFVMFSTPYHLWAEVIEVLFYFGILCWVAVGCERVIKKF